MSVQDTDADDSSTDAHLSDAGISRFLTNKRELGFSPREAFRRSVVESDEIGEEQTRRLARSELDTFEAGATTPDQRRYIDYLRDLLEDK